MEHGFESVGVFIIEMLLKNNYSLLLPELKTKKGQRHVRKFWRKTKGFMKYALAKEVQAFLMTKGVIASKEM
jgi:SRSO17 transposase